MSNSDSFLTRLPVAGRVALAICWVAAVATSWYFDLPGTGSIMLGSILIYAIWLKQAVGPFERADDPYFFWPVIIVLALMVFSGTLELAEFIGLGR